MSGSATRQQTVLHQLDRLRHYYSRFVGWLDDFARRIAPPDEDETGSPVGIARVPIIFGVTMMFLVFGLFGIWSAIAPLSSAAIAGGKVVLDSNRKTIQHLEGGIIEKILVYEGKYVEAGDPLIRLNETAARARFDLFHKQYIAAKAAEARLIAERDQLDEISFPADLLDEAQKDEAVAEIVNSQRNLFASRRETLLGQTGILQQKIEQFNREIEGLEAQVDSAAQQIALLEEEISTVKKLLAQGNAQKPRLLALQRNKADLEGQQGEYVARISRAEQSIAEARLQINNLQTEFMNKVVSELKDTQIQISDLEERLRASTDVVDRIIISAPISGIVTNLRVHTIGGVIAPGAAVMDIVPQGEKLIVEAKVSPQDIDVVHAGLEAQVRLTAYRARKVPTLTGRVIHVSPDRFEDERTGIAYFKARIEISKEELDRHEEVELTPGMSADVQIVTGERTLLSYLISPIVDSFNQAFRED